MASRLDLDRSGFKPTHPHYVEASFHAADVILEFTTHGVKGGVASLPLLAFLALIDLASNDLTDE